MVGFIVSWLKYITSSKQQAKRVMLLTLCGSYLYSFFVWYSLQNNSVVVLFMLSLLFSLSAISLLLSLLLTISLFFTFSLPAHCCYPFVYIGFLPFLYLLCYECRGRRTGRNMRLLGNWNHVWKTSVTSTYMTSNLNRWAHGKELSPSTS